VIGPAEPGRPWTRAEYVAFVRTHHPDVGGDRVVFQTGLAEFRAARRGAARNPAAPDDNDFDNDELADDSRFDGPVIGVDRQPVAQRLVSRAVRWRDRRRRPRVQ
jgi:hypothetical protein